MSKQIRLAEVPKEIQDAFTKDLDAICEKHGVKLMPTMFIVKEEEYEPEEKAPIAEEAPLA